jgi:hypothetical protein
VTADLRFYERFAPRVAGFQLPMKILQLRGPGLVDVTRAHPRGSAATRSLVAPHPLDRRDRRRPAPGEPDARARRLRPQLAAYAAEERLLGRRAVGDARVAHEVARGRVTRRVPARAAAASSRGSATAEPARRRRRWRGVCGPHRAGNSLRRPRPAPGIHEPASAPHRPRLRRDRRRPAPPHPAGVDRGCRVATISLPDLASAPTAPLEDLAAKNGAASQAAARSTSASASRSRPQTAVVQREPRGLPGDAPAPAGHRRRGVFGRSDRRCATSELPLPISNAARDVPARERGTTGGDVPVLSRPSSRSSRRRRPRTPTPTSSSAAPAERSSA